MTSFCFATLQVKYPQLVCSLMGKYIAAAKKNSANQYKYTLYRVV